MRLNQPRLRYVVAVVALLLAGGSAFLLGRYALSGDAPTEAQVSPSGTPVLIEQPPHPSIAAAMTAIAEDNEKPRFIGELNGFQFIGMDTPIPRDGQECSNAELQPVPSTQVHSAIRDSDLNFEVGNITSGLSLARETATLCQGQVVSVGRTYEGSEGRSIEIFRVKSGPVVQSFAPLDRLKPTTIGGRPSILVVPVGFGPTIIFMRDEIGTKWTINGFELNTDEVTKVAEEIR